MSKKRSHYRASTKAGFTAGELAGLLNSHGPGADYKVVISMRGKVRELIVDEEEGPGPVRYAEPGADLVGRVDCLAPDHTPGNACETPADDQRHGGKLEATFHGTAATYPPGELTDEALNARFGDPLKGNLDRLHSGERPPGGRTRFAGRANTLRAAQGFPPLTPDEEAKWERILDEDAKRRTRYLEGH